MRGRTLFGSASSSVFCVLVSFDGDPRPREAFVDVSARVAPAAGGVLPAPLPSVCPRLSARSFVSCFVPGLKATGAKQGSRGCYGR